MELVLALAHRRAGRLRRLAAAAAAHLPGRSSACRCSPTRSTSSSSRWAGCAVGAPPMRRRPARRSTPPHYADPVPQALVLTAIVISFATTALFLVVLLASRGLTGTDHVDGREPRAMSRWPDHLMIAPILLPLVAGRADAALRRAPPQAEGRSSACVAAIAAARRSRSSPCCGIGGIEAAIQASTCSATGRRPSASCWCSTGCRR